MEIIRSGWTELKTALVDYAKANIDPHKACEEMGKFKSKDIAQINAAAMPAGATTPAHCRVTGLLSPEIAFEVSLPSKCASRGSSRSTTSGATRTTWAPRSAASRQARSSACSVSSCSSRGTTVLRYAIACVRSAKPRALRRSSLTSGSLIG